MNTLNTSFKINNSFNLSYSSVVQQNHIILKGDSGVLNHYISVDDSNHLQKQRTNDNMSVTLPNSDTLTSTGTSSLNIPALPETANKAYTILGLTNQSLLSLGQLVDNGCIILLNKKYMHFFKNFELILKGIRNQTDGLWDVPIPKHKNHHMNVITPVKQHTNVLIQYIHAALFSPVKSTFIKAIKTTMLLDGQGSW